MGPTSEGAEAAAASSCRLVVVVVAVAVRIAGSLVGPCRRVQPASSSSISNSPIHAHTQRKERERERENKAKAMRYVRLCFKERVVETQTLTSNRVLLSVSCHGYLFTFSYGTISFLFYT